ncbi:MAG: hypothetical protein F4W95_04430 [Chloroflexi bacterium]|nr:hypothetical protein [Chloroflexota bacterium]MYD47718.1 hypothetical protein [Chloroflexota bacterium]
MATLVPLIAMALPWVTLDGGEQALTGIGVVVLLLPPMNEYLFTVSPLQAAILTLGPVLIVLLAIVTSYNYQRRQSIYWAPPVMLIAALAIVYGTADLVAAIEPGLITVVAFAALLSLHQVAIRIQVVLRRKTKMPRV